MLKSYIKSVFHGVFSFAACPRRIPMILMAHPTDCNKYINCANGKGFLSSCPGDTVFNVRTGQCLYTWDPKLKGKCRKVTTQAPEVTTAPKPKPQTPQVVETLPKTTPPPQPPQPTKVVETPPKTTQPQPPKPPTTQPETPPKPAPTQPPIQPKETMPPVKGKMISLIC